MITFYAYGIARILARCRRMFPNSHIDMTNIRDHANQRHNHSLIRRLGGQK